MDILSKNTPIWAGPCPHLMVDLTITSSNTATVKLLTINEDLYFSEVIMNAQLFHRLMESLDLSPTNFGFNLKLTVFDLETGSPDEFEINGEDLKISMLEQWGQYGLEIKDIEIAEGIWRQWKWSESEGGIGNQDAISENDEFEGEITLTLCLDHIAVSKLYFEGFGKKFDGDCSIDLLIEGVEADMVILGGGEKDKEKGIKCHKKILSGCSQVFEAMLQADMSESKENCVEIVDMTADGVKAMLQFIYDGYMEAPMKKGEICVDLLEMGHRYEVKYLEEAMMQIIWAKAVDWLSVDLVLKLLLFSRNVGGWGFEKTEKTCLAILKWHALNKPGSLKMSKEYKRLFLEYPRIAMDIGEAFLRI